LVIISGTSRGDTYLANSAAFRCDYTVCASTTSAFRLFAAGALDGDEVEHAIGVPSSLLIFPGKGHPLAKNPWHEKIKVREELKWLDKYALGKMEQ
jgi:hypothetical protein